MYCNESKPSVNLLACSAKFLSPDNSYPYHKVPGKNPVVQSRTGASLTVPSGLMDLGFIPGVKVCAAFVN
ncbi:hypothetical protein D3C86_1122110 [compost metagenome]